MRKTKKNVSRKSWTWFHLLVRFELVKLVFIKGQNIAFDVEMSSIFVTSFSARILDVEPSFLVDEDRLVTVENGKDY